jgi:HlyD family secretion protein
MWLAIIAIALTSCHSAHEPKTIRPHIGVIQKTFTAQAKTRLANVYRLSMPLSGELERITLEVGSPVQKDQVVAQLEQVPLEEAIKKTQAEEAAVAANYAYQDLQLKRRKTLEQHGFISSADIDNLLAQKKIFEAYVKGTHSLGTIAQYHLAQSKIRSPIQGVVLWRYTQGGQWIAEGAPLLDIGNLSELEVVADVLTQDAQLLVPGGPVVLTSAGNTFSLDGKIKRIEPQGFTKKSSLGVDEQRVNVVIDISHPNNVQLGVGYRLDAQFLVGTQDPNALIIPRFSVLQDDQGHFYVLKVIHHQLKKQIVELGLSSDTETAITQGLSVNDDFVSQPSTDMEF